MSGRYLRHTMSGYKDDEGGRTLVSMHVEEMRTRMGAREGEVIGAGSGARNVHVRGTGYGVRGTWSYWILDDTHLSNFRKFHICSRPGVRPPLTHWRYGSGSSR